MLQPAAATAADMGLDASSGIRIRAARGDGVILDGDSLPFHDAQVRPAEPGEVADWLERLRSLRSPTIGELLLAPGVPADLDAGGFNRHTFMCGQSGSGKTYSSSASAVADSKQTLLCTYLSAVLLVGLSLNAAFGWWWADPVTGLAIAAVALKGRARGVAGRRLLHAMRLRSPAPSRRSLTSVQQRDSSRPQKDGDGWRHLEADPRTVATVGTRPCRRSRFDDPASMARTRPKRDPRTADPPARRRTRLPTQPLPSRQHRPSVSRRHHPDADHRRRHRGDARHRRPTDSTDQQLATCRSRTFPRCVCAGIRPAHTTERCSHMRRHAARTSPRSSAGVAQVRSHPRDNALVLAESSCAPPAIRRFVARLVRGRRPAAIVRCRMSRPPSCARSASMISSRVRPTDCSCRASRSRSTISGG